MSEAYWFQDSGYNFGGPGIHFRGLGHPWAHFWPSWRQNRFYTFILYVIFQLLADLRFSRGAQERPKEPKGYQSNPESGPQSSSLEDFSGCGEFVKTVLSPWSQRDLAGPGGSRGHLKAKET